MTTRHFPTNTVGRDFVVGDLHGCLDQLQELLQAAAFDTSRDRLFSVGDLIDRGPDSMGCLRLVREPWFFAVAGNHEAMALAALGSEDFAPTLIWRRNGGEWGAGLTRPERNEAVDLLIVLPLAIAVGEGLGRFNVLRAEFFGTDADLDAGGFTEAQRNAMLWGRSIIEDDARPPSAGLSRTYVGHTPVPAPALAGSLCFIDTWAFKHGKGDRYGLTLVEPATGEAWATAPGAPALDWEGAA